MCVEQIPVRFPELAIDNERDENVSRGILFAGVTTLTGGLGIRFK